MVVSESRCAIADQYEAKIPDHESITDQKSLKSWMRRYTSGSQTVCSDDHTALIPDVEVDITGTGPSAKLTWSRP